MNQDRTEKAMEYAAEEAKHKFRRFRDREEMVNDAISRAWEFATQHANERATFSTIGGYAVRSVKIGRQFRGSTRSVDHRRHRLSRARLPLEAVEFARPGADPAMIAQVQIDVTDWLKQLSSLLRKVATLYATGYRTGQIARLLQKTDSRISQIRKELRANWAEFTGEG